MRREGKEAILKVFPVAGDFKPEAPKLLPELHTRGFQYQRRAMLVICRHSWIGAIEAFRRLYTAGEYLLLS